MVIQRITVLMLFIFLAMNATSALAEHAPGETHTFRTLLTIGGAIGGAVLGAAIGEASGSNSIQNAATGGVVGFSCGIVGGYFLGRKIDKSRIPKAKPDPDPQKVKEAQKRAMETISKKYDAWFLKSAPEQLPGK